MNSSFKVFFIAAAVSTNSVVAQTPLKTLDIALGEWRPVISSEKQGYGATAELVTVILKRMGYQANITFTPWGHAERLLKNNEKNQGVRASFPYIKTHRREKYYLFSEQPIFSSCMVFFYNKNKFPIGIMPKLKTVGDLKRFNIGYVSTGGGFQYPSELTEILNQKGVAYDSLYKVFDKLLDPFISEVQVVPAVAEIGSELLIDLFPSSRSIIEIFEEVKPKQGKQCLLPVNYFLIMSKRNPNNSEFMRKFNKTHKSIDSETLSRIKQRASEKPSASQPAVALQLTQRTEKIIGRSETGSEYTIPRGTQGLLIKWQLQSSHDPQDVKIYITTGPFRGSTLSVNKKFVVLKENR